MKIATLCYIQNKDKVLMIHRNKRQGDMLKDFWNGVGGKIADNESPEECIIREVQEETGLTITKPKLKGILTFPNNHDRGETWYVFVFTTTKFSGKLAENDEGSLEWISTDDLNKLRLQPADSHFIPWLKKKAIFSAKFNFVSDDLIDYSVNFYK